MKPDYLDRALADSRVLELRTKTPHGWRSGLFDSRGHLYSVIRRVTEAGLTGYLTLNRPRPDLVASNAMTDDPLRDDDIATITRLPFDLDPVRPTGASSTDAELAAAMRVRVHLVNLLSAAGWPMPALGMSGNGAHAVYRVMVKNTAEWRTGVATLYYAIRSRLAEVCAAERVAFDVSVRNPARVWRIYGTVNAKGEATSDRPHRRAEITLPAGPWQAVPLRILERTITTWSPVVQAEQRQTRQERREAVARIEGRGDYSTLNVVAWFAAHGAYGRPLTDRRHAVRCPWTEEHSTAPRQGDSSTVVWETSAGGWPTFHCSHAHCQGRQLADVLALWRDADGFCSRTWERNHG